MLGNNNKKLAGAVLALLLLVGILWLTDRRKQSSFDRFLIKIHPSELTRVELFPQLIDDTVGYALVKYGEDWYVEKGDETLRADLEFVEAMLMAFNNIRITRLVARTEDQWNLYCVTDSVGSRVKAYAGNHKVADFHIGALVFIDPSGEGSETHGYFDYDLIHLYVRRSESSDVYMASGFFSYHFTRPYDEWYDRTLVSSDPYFWDEIQMVETDSLLFSMKRQGVKWYLNDHLLDEAAMSAYLHHLSHLRGQLTLGGYPPNEPLFVRELRLISARNSDTIKVRSVGYEGDVYFFESTQNPGTVFHESSDSIYRSIFVIPPLK